MTLVSKSFSEIVTFSRSSNATRVGPTGRVEYAPHNLFLQSQTFQTTWATAQASVTVNAVAAPDGTVTADTLIENTTNDDHAIYQSVTVPAQSSTFSVYVKAAGRTKFQLREGSNGDIYNFDLSSPSGNITSVGNGWYRCWLTATPASTTFIAQIYLRDSAGNKVYTGDGTSGIYLWGAQLSVGPYALDYTPTTSAAVYGPRFDYDPVTLAARGLLVEEQRTNLLTYSDDFSNAAWDKGSGFTLTPNAIASPDGTINADLFVRGSTLSFAWLSQSFSGNANQALTFSCWVRTVSGSSSIALVISDVNLASVGSSSLSINTTWQRLSFSITAGQLSNTGVIGVGFTMSSGQSAYFWGAQLEAGSFATSYIPTVASTVTRSADVASVNTLSPWWNATESTIYSEFDTFSTNDAFPYALGTKNNNEVDVYRIGSNGNVATLMFTSTVLQNNSTIATGTALNATIKAAYAIKANDLAGSANGGAAVTDTTATLPSVSTLYLGARDDGTGPLNGHLRRLAVYPRRLTNAEIQALTS